MHNGTTTYSDELRHVLTCLQSTQLLLQQARDRAAHLQGDGAEKLLLEIETLLQEIYLDTDAMVSERTSSGQGSDEPPATDLLDLDSFLEWSSDTSR